MSFVFPKSVDALKVGQDLYRVRANSPASGVVIPNTFGLGDILPISVGISAIAVGPDSVYESYEIVYPDVTQERRAQSALLSTATPLFLPVSSDQTNYPNTVQPSDIFIRPMNLQVEADSGFLSILDLLIYIAESRPPLSATQRNPQAISFPLRFEDPAPFRDYVFPAYGRRCFQFAIDRSGVGVGDITVEVTGQKAVPASEPDFAEVRDFELLASTTITPGAERFVWSYNAEGAGSFGRFDAYQVRIDSDFAHDPSVSDTEYKKIFFWAEARD